MFASSSGPGEGSGAATTATVLASQKTHSDPNSYTPSHSSHDDDAAARLLLQVSSKRDAPHGLGCIVFSDGNEYSGEWRQGLKHGSGEFLFPDGESYAGRYERNRMKGCGVYLYATGDIYEVNGIVLAQRSCY